MQLATLVWSGIWRARVRTCLVLLQILVAFILYGLLYGMSGALKNAVAQARADVLYVTGRVRGDSLPLAYLERISEVDGVQIVNPQNFLLGEYQDPKNKVIAIATNPQAYFTINDYCRVSPSQLEALMRTRDGAIVGADLARQYGWKLGERVPLNSSTLQKDGSDTWVFEIVGIYEYPDEPDMASLLIFNNEYFDAARAKRSDSVSRFVVKVRDVDIAPSVIGGIDERFLNSAHETATTSENESAQVRVQSMGDLNFVASTITAAAFAALLLSVGTTVMNSIRERIPELAVLKALGFSNAAVGALIFGEVLAVCLVAAMLGLCVAWQLLPLARDYAGLIEMPLSVVVQALVCAVSLATICAVLPVRYALKLQIVQALNAR